MKSILTAVALASLLAACADNPGAPARERTLADREETTGTMLHHRGNGDAQVINKDQIDPNQILNPAATQPHVGH